MRTIIDTMPTFHEVFNSLKPSHQTALKWFVEHRGQEVPWLAPLPDGTLLVNRPKGIHKPAGWEYALSVRQMMTGPYADGEPTVLPDGTWNYQYFQEGTDPSLRDSYYTNVALMACIRDRVPIGVLRQISESPDTRYKVMGLAWVAEWQNDGYFMLQGLSPSDEIIPTDSGTSLPKEADDVRKRIGALILQRQGQGQFRASLINAYQGCCAITKYDAVSALEAAHIDPYSEGGKNSPSNGLLLRADLHTLFDLGLIAIDGETMSVLVSPSLAGTLYSNLAGTQIALPLEPDARPSPIALAAHRSWAKL